MSISGKGRGRCLVGCLERGLFNEGRVEIYEGRTLDDSINIKHLAIFTELTFVTKDYPITLGVCSFLLLFACRNFNAVHISISGLNA